jgi:hypothetical protein
VQGLRKQFHSKIQQIGEDNTKGTLVTSSSLQRSALTFARSKGIGVIRLLPDNQVIHIMEMITAASLTSVDWSEFENALIDPNHRSRQAFFALHDEHFFASGTPHSRTNCPQKNRARDGGQLTTLTPLL